MLKQDPIRSELPSIVLVGRPNVGKSTIFNALTHSRQAIVADREGVTRDRRFGVATPDQLARKEICVVDTGGWLPEKWREGHKNQAILIGIEDQVRIAIDNANLVMLIVDARAGLTNLDIEIAKYLKKCGQKFFVLANKCDTDKQDFLDVEFHGLGASEVLKVSAEHKRGLSEVWFASEPYLKTITDKAAEHIATIESDMDPELVAREFGVKTEDPIRICIVGRPNVGKSSLLNCLLGEDRAIASPIPGTTTDAIDVPIKRGKHDFVLIDTAGIRRHSKRADNVENLSVMYAQRNLVRSDIAILMVDASNGITSQDARIASLVEEAGCSAIILANKWDLAPNELQNDPKEALRLFTIQARKEIPFLDYAPILSFSAVEKCVYSYRAGVEAKMADKFSIPNTLDGLWGLLYDLVQFRNQKLATSAVNKLVQKVTLLGPNTARSVGKIYFAHQSATRPPEFTAFVKKADKVPENLRRYLIKTTRADYGFRGNPIRWKFENKSKD